jgi:uncharacterized protein YbjT (DUF2867 family)
VANTRKVILPALEAARKAGVGRVCFLSLVGMDGMKTVPHRAVEDYLRSSGQDYAFPRAGFFMQNLDTTHRAEIRDRDELYVPAGDSRASFVDVRDLGEVAALALLEGRGRRVAWELPGAEALDYHEVAILLSRALGRRISYRRPSGAAYVARRLAEGESLGLALISAWLYANTRKGMAQEASGELERLLGRPPRSMRQYVEDHRWVWQRPPA